MRVSDENIISCQTVIFLIFHCCLSILGASDIGGLSDLVRLKIAPLYITSWKKMEAHARILKTYHELPLRSNRR